MLKNIVKKLSKKLVLYNFLRKVIEFNFINIKQTIVKEFTLNKPIIKETGIRFLDIPCGTGEFCMLFDISSYVGIDISVANINYARKVYNRSFYCRDARDTGFDNSSFDAILVLGLLHHLDISDVMSTLVEMKRIIKKDGKLLLIEDIPVLSKWNLIGKLLQRYDVGSSIRTTEEYGKLIEAYFFIRECYPIKSGFWNYSVFSLEPK